MHGQDHLKQRTIPSREIAVDRGLTAAALVLAVVVIDDWRMQKIWRRVVFLPCTHSLGMLSAAYSQCRMSRGLRHAVLPEVLVTSRRVCVWG